MNYYELYGIPKEIYIFAKKIKITFDEDLAGIYNYNGLSDFQQCTIKLQPNCEKYFRTRESVIITFWHEVIHFIFKNLGYEELSCDEELIPLMASVLHQITVGLEKIPK